MSDEYPAPADADTADDTADYSSEPLADTAEWVHDLTGLTMPTQECEDDTDA